MKNMWGYLHSDPLCHSFSGEIFFPHKTSPEREIRNLFVAQVKHKELKYQGSLYVWCDFVRRENLQAHIMSFLLFFPL